VFRFKTLYFGPETLTRTNRVVAAAVVVAAVVVAIFTTHQSMFHFAWLTWRTVVVEQSTRQNETKSM